MNKALKISGVVVLLVALIYLVVGTFFMGGGKTNTEFSGFGKMFAPAKNTKSTDKLEVNIDRVLINLHSGSFSYLKTDMAFRMKDKRDKDVLVKNMPSVRNTILQFSARQDGDELATNAGKDRYIEDLKELMFESYGLAIEDIFFRDFVLAK